MPAYYNEIDPKAAAWLRELIKQGHIADGVVDERSIVDVTPDELRGFTQCHFFAGIGVWSYALRSAGWDDDRPVWTGSCPCQPFSAAGARGGFDDQRHLWPHWHHLISQCRPPVVLGEQVASKDGLGWLDLVHADMEATGYAFGAADLCAAGVGAPHIRQRLWFVGLADAADAGLQIGRGRSGGEPRSVEQSERLRADGGMADAQRLGPALGLPAAQGRHERHADVAGDGGDRQSGPGAGQPGAGGLEHPQSDGREQWRPEPSGRGAASGCGGGGLADADGGDTSAEWQQRGWQQRQQPEDGGAEWLADAGSRSVSQQERRPDQRDGHAAALPEDQGPDAPDLGWSSADWLFCRDGKWRPVEPGTFPLVARTAAGMGFGRDNSAQNPDDSPEARVMRLRGYGNAICAEVASTFISAFMEANDGFC